MKTKFICTDNEQIKIQDCLEKCRMSMRCASVSFLKLVAEERPPEQFSVTGGLKGTRELYLKATKDFGVKPEDFAFAILGTRSHSRLDTSIENEIKLEYKGIVGTADEYEPDTKTLIDHKTWGSYQVALLLGIKVEKIKVSDGVYKNGKEKFKTKSIYKKVEPDIFDVAMQLNMYRIMLEQKNYEIDYLKMQCFVRDGGTYIAKNRGIDKTFYYIDIPIWDDKKVLDFYFKQRDAFKEALESGKTKPCNDRECWNGNKCKKYCYVANYCEGNIYLEVTK